MLKVVWRWRQNKNVRLAQILCFLWAGPYCCVLRTWYKVPLRGVVDLKSRRCRKLILQGWSRIVVKHPYLLLRVLLYWRFSRIFTFLRVVADRCQTEFLLFIKVRVYEWGVPFTRKMIFTYEIGQLASKAEFRVQLVCCLSSPSSPTTVLVLILWKELMGKGTRFLCVCGMCIPGTTVCTAAVLILIPYGRCSTQ